MKKTTQWQGRVWQYLLGFMLLFMSSSGFGQSNVIITEVCDASTYQASFVEVYNAGDASEDITGWTLSEIGSTIFTVGSVTLAPGEYITFVRETQTDLEGLFGSYAGDYIMTGAGVMNGSDYFELKNSNNYKKNAVFEKHDQKS